MANRITFRDESIVNENDDAGPCQLHDGILAYSIFVRPNALEREVILTEGELQAMLAAIDREESPS